MSLEFLITSLIVVLIPGTGVIYTLAIGLGRGFWPCVLAAFGCTLGIIPHLVASVLGLAALLHASALLFQAIKFLGVAYLFYMAWGIWKEGGVLDVNPATTKRSAGKLIQDGILLNLLNPKLSIFFLAFLPQFIPGASPSPTLLMGLLATVFMAMTFVCFVLYGALAAATGNYVLSKPGVMNWLRRSFALAFGLLGLRLALTER